MNVASRMDSTGEIWKIQVPDHTAMLLQEKGYTCVPRGEIIVKGKGTMLTYWVLGKNESVSRLTSPTICPAGIPSSITPTATLQRQTSNHSSLAAVVFGIIRAEKHNTWGNSPSTRKSMKTFFSSYLFSVLFPSSIDSQSCDKKWCARARERINRIIVWTTSRFVSHGRWEKVDVSFGPFGPIQLKFF